MTILEVQSPEVLDLHLFPPDWETIIPAGRLVEYKVRVSSGVKGTREG